MTQVDARPAHATVSAVLRRELRDGRYPDGQSLPVESALSERFGVGRSAIRQALDTLVIEGLITRQAGRGTFPVRRDPEAPWVRVVGDLRRVMAIGNGTRFEADNALRREQSSEAAHRLRLGDRGVWVIRGVRFLGETRVGHWELFLPPNYGERLGEGFLLDEQHPTLIGSLVRELGIAVRRAEQTITAAECPPDVAARLDVLPGSPVLTIDRVFYDSRDEPVQFARSRYRPDEYQYRLDLLPIADSEEDE